jgi:hypothetical protein
MLHEHARFLHEPQLWKNCTMASGGMRDARWDGAAIEPRGFMSDPVELDRP